MRLPRYISTSLDRLPPAEHSINESNQVFTIDDSGNRDSGKPTLCNFDYSGALIENNLLALVAYRVGKELQWSEKDLAANCPDADQYIRKTYREGWVLNG